MSKSLVEIKDIVKDLDKNLSMEDDAYKAAVILLSAITTDCGQNIRKLTKFTDYPIEFVREVAAGARNNGLWKNGKTYCDWFDEETGGISFWLDVCVCLGLIMRAKEKTP